MEKSTLKRNKSAVVAFEEKNGAVKMGKKGLGTSNKKKKRKKMKKMMS